MYVAFALYMKQLKINMYMYMYLQVHYCFFYSFTLTDEASFYYEVFHNIGRESRVREYYTQCHKVTY